MEKDIILEGFRRSVEMHGVKYTRLIADGDSSTYRGILEAAPYGTQQVEKVECANHLLRNYFKNVFEIVERKRQRPFPVHLKKLVKQNAYRLRKGVVSALRARSAEEAPLCQRIAGLIVDIKNGPCHVFGEHKGCASYFCNGIKLNEENHVPALRECGLFDELFVVVNRLAGNASSLILDCNNNAAEHFNSLVAKLVGGKRINFTQRGAYNTRCFAASLAMNSQGEYHRHVSKAICKNSPGKFTKAFLKMQASRRTSRLKQRPSRQLRCRRSLLQPSPPKVVGPDVDYGKPSMEPEALAQASELFLDSLKLSAEEAGKLQEDTKDQSASPLWKQERRKRCTASHFGEICKMMETTSCKRMVGDLLYKEINTVSLQYGRDNEHRAIRQLESELGVVVERCGLFVDLEYPFLAASPDGLIGADTIVEVKCPFSSRSLTPLEGVRLKKNRHCIEADGSLTLKKSSHYWYQIQGQLHIARRDFSLFVIWTEKGMSVETISRDDYFWEAEMFPRLERFYKNCLLPELVDPCRSRNQPIRDPEYIVQAQKRQAEKKQLQYMKKGIQLGSKPSLATT